MGRAAPQGGRQVRAAGSGTVLPLGSGPGAFSEPFSRCALPFAPSARRVSSLRPLPEARGMLEARALLLFCIPGSIPRGQLL